MQGLDIDDELEWRSKQNPGITKEAVVRILRRSHAFRQYIASKQKLQLMEDNFEMVERECVLEFEDWVAKYECGKNHETQTEFDLRMFRRKQDRTRSYRIAETAYHKAREQLWAIGEDPGQVDFEQDVPFEDRSAVLGYDASITGDEALPEGCGERYMIQDWINDIPGACEDDTSVSVHSNEENSSSVTSLQPWDSLSNPDEFGYRRAIDKWTSRMNEVRKSLQATFPSKQPESVLEGNDVVG